MMFPCSLGAGFKYWGNGEFTMSNHFPKTISNIVQRG